MDENDIDTSRNRAVDTLPDAGGAVHPKASRFETVRVISLKWKALGVLSLVLFAIIAALSWLSYSKLLGQFEASRSAEESVYARQIRALLRQTDTRLQQISSWVPALEGMADALFQGDPKGLQRLFERHWPSAQLEFDLQSVGFYALNGDLVGRWDDGSPPPMVPLEWVTQVAREEQPVYTLTCSDRCYQVGLLPLLAEDKTVGTLALTTSVAELIVRFREVTGRDIGILVRPREEPGATADESGGYLRPWDLKVVALSDAPNRMHLLRRAADKVPFLLQGSEPIQIDEGGRHYSIRLFPLQEFTPYGSGYFLVLSDLTEAVQRIRTGAWKSLVAGVVGVVVSELVLFLILSAPLTRLQRTAQVLPLLAEHGFGEVRAQLQSIRRGRGAADEIDELDRTAIDLSHQLEELNEEVRERTDTLKLRMSELDRERSFVTNLLDTAKVVIITQDRDGRIGLANKHAMDLTGFPLGDLVGRPFLDLLNPLDSRGCAADLARVRRRESILFSHEAELLCASGQRLQVAWFHSALDTEQEDGAVALSAGLDITERKQAERRIAWLADHDPLTGLVNRRCFEDVLRKALRSGLDSRESSGALMYIDLDQFKLINDTQGHSAGDRVLEAFSGNLARLTDVIAPGRQCVAARLGGDEFAVLVQGVDRNGAMDAAERLRDGLNRLEYAVGSEVFKVTLSLGVALYPEHGLGFQELMQNADLAMYKAKSLGEGRVQLFSGDEAMRLHMAQRLRWKDRIDEALAGDRLVLHFQPILELATGNITHFEALVRMQDEHGELVSPINFIPVAESTGQITAIDCRVLDLVFDSWRRFHGAGQNLGLHINLSARAFQTSEWLLRLNTLLDETGADPSLFVFEITETAAVTDIKDAKALMDTVKAKGCRFALDDFGVGFSSFNYVKELPVDMLKIDGTFITGLSGRRDSQLVVKALVDIARGFGRETVAEFVDSAETMDLLRELGVDFAQGYYVGRPTGEAELLARSKVAC